MKFEINSEPWPFKKLASKPVLSFNLHPHHVLPLLRVVHRPFLSLYFRPSWLAQQSLWCQPRVMVRLVNIF